MQNWICVLVIVASLALKLDLFVCVFNAGIEGEAVQGVQRSATREDS